MHLKQQAPSVLSYNHNTSALHRRAINFTATMMPFNKLNSFIYSSQVPLFKQGVFILKNVSFSN
ncbi:MAG: hypothetical protein IGQ45_09765 [Cyanobacterium sp. T60_A2020_053]|nr:hypothetical protein [Cyanobacterium sp. T60_A2020_053]